MTDDFAVLIFYQDCVCEWKWGLASIEYDLKQRIMYGGSVAYGGGEGDFDSDKVRIG